ncbi:hypothetical protein [Streptomyces sp. NPDC002132]
MTTPDWDADDRAEVATEPEAGLGEEAVDEAGGYGISHRAGSPTGAVS